MALVDSGINVLLSIFKLSFQYIDREIWNTAGKTLYIRIITAIIKYPVIYKIKCYITVNSRILRPIFREIMATKQLGYARLITDYQLKALPLEEYAQIDSSVRGRERREVHGQVVSSFEPRYQPDDTLSGHLQFALKYEGVNLQVLGLLFEQAIQDQLENWILTSPASSYARRACFLYEWITGRTLSDEIRVPGRERYVDAADDTLQFVLPGGERNTRYRVNNNLPGVPEFCPMVRKTEYLQKMVAKDLRAQVGATLAKYDQNLLKRAAAFLYLKETQSSFEVEREKPSQNKAQRFVDMLKQADSNTPLTAERFSQLQNAAIDPRFHEYTWRSEQNWVGKDHGYRKQIDFIPARPEDLAQLMSGLIETVSKCGKYASKNDAVSGEDKRYDPIVFAAAVSFGFVFIHPFMDGNGRIHRYLIHDVLARTEFTPRGIILPVSAVILANLDDYVSVLENFSRPMRELSDYNPEVPAAPATGNNPIYFSFFDATRQAEFLYHSLQLTFEEDLQKEIEYLLGFDRAYDRLNQIMDWPKHSLELFIQVVHQNNAKLSSTKHNSHFHWMTSQEISDSEEVVTEAFRLE